MPASHVRRLSTAGATIALAAAGLVAPTTAAFAAEGLTVTPASPAAGSAFEVKATGLTANGTYNVVLTQAGDSNKSSVAESTSCTTADAGVTRICTVREDTPGTYEAKLLGANDVLIAKAAVTVGTSVSVTGPKVNDNAGAADSVTLTYVKGVKWESKVGSGAWTAVDFGTPNPAATKDVTFTTADPSSDVSVRASAEAGYVLTGPSEFTVRLTNAATPPAALTVPSAAQPVKTDVAGTSADKLTLTKVDNIDWYVDGTKISFGANETSKTISVTPDKAKDYVVKVQARAVAPNSFSGGRLAEDFNQTYSDVKAEPGIVRVAGDDRAATAVEVSKKYFPGQRDTVYVANGLRFPDALTAGPAAAKDKGPLLLSAGTWIGQTVLDEIKAKAPKKIVVVGGSDVVSSGVAGELGKIAPVTRLEGANRYSTATAVSGTWSGSGTVYLANGLNFPDALSGGSGAASKGAPLLLSNGTSLSDETIVELRRLKPTKVVLVGGESVLSTAVAKAVGDAVSGVSVDRAAGKDRYHTSALIMEHDTIAKADADRDKQTTAFLATGLNYPDALAGIPAAASVNAPLGLVMTGCVPASVKAQLDRMTKLENTVRLGSSNIVGNFPLTSVCG